MTSPNPKPKKKDFFWITVVVGACFVFLISILIGRFFSSYLVKTLPKTTIKMPEGTPNPKGYTGLTPYTLLTPTATSGLTQTVKPSPGIAQSADATKLTQEQKTKTTKALPSEKNTEEEGNTPGNVNETPPDEGNADNEQGTSPEAQNVKISPPKPSTAPSGEKPKDEKSQNTIYKVQLGAFSTKDNAQNLINELKGKGVDATVVPLKKDGKDYFRVQAGAYKNKESADKLAGDLKNQGYPVFISGKQ